MFDLTHDLGDALLFLKNIVGELLRREVLEVGGSIRILAVEVTAVGEQFRYGHFPGAFIFLPLVQPSKEQRILQTGWAAFGVILSAFGKRPFVVPDFFRRMRAVEEEEIRRDAGYAKVSEKNGTFFAVATGFLIVHESDQFVVWEVGEFSNGISDLNGFLGARCGHLRFEI